MAIINRISDDVIGVQGENGGAFPYCNTYMIREGRELIVIDPHCGDDHFRKGLAAMERSVEEITAVLATHYHVDHSTPCRRLASEFGIPVYMHLLDAPAVSSWSAMYARYGIRNGALKQMLQRMFGDIAGFQPFRVTHPFDGDSALPAGIEVIHSPGHTPGHCCFLYRGLLFSGDVELNVPWVGNINSNVDAFLETASKLAAMHFRGVLPGHGLPCLTDTNRAFSRYYGKLIENAEKVYGALAEAPQTLDDITQRARKVLSPSVRGMFEGENGPLLIHLEQIANHHYLKYLEARGRAEKTVCAGGKTLWARTEGDHQHDAG